MSVQDKKVRVAENMLRKAVGDVPQYVLPLIDDTSAWEVQHGILQYKTTYRKFGFGIVAKCVRIYTNLPSVGKDYAVFSRKEAGETVRVHTKYRNTDTDKDRYKTLSTGNVLYMVCANMGGSEFLVEFFPICQFFKTVEHRICGFKATGIASIRANSLRDAVIAAEATFKVQW